MKLGQIELKERLAVDIKQINNIADDIVGNILAKQLKSYNTQEKKAFADSLVIALKKKIIEIK